MSNLAGYLIGVVLVIAGLAYGASLIGIGGRWILIGAMVLLGLGVMGGITRTRQRETPPTEEKS